MTAQMHPLPAPGRRNLSLRGFTLIELMIVVAVVAILAAIAYPSYLEHIRKSRRSEAKTALLDLAARQERNFSIQNTYSKLASDLGYGASRKFPLDVVGGGTAFYQIDVTAATASGYTAIATPIGSQIGDRCGTFELNELGAQALKSASATPAECW